MVVTLLVPVRAIYGLENLITLRHLGEHEQDHHGNGLDGRNRLRDRILYRLVFGGVRYEGYAFINRAFGNFWWAYWIMVSCNVLIPQLFWFKKCRTTPWIMVVICIFVNIGMWFERFVITITSLVSRLPAFELGVFSSNLDRLDDVDR